ncbi:hypothetical protein LELG_04015 [Lodderomyces elongisporus NRRL YB-4239]|uniref:DNA-directed RNA polymerase III subunit RPC9 n=1 Tax=Lodderomyces elongisporus (strain ATCC 11503 / CBS 2605 / JCM 1781 / NBRC 1676 / NRRL YB-4239) TaxID=379508 RepID=A5E328_LODEL|nr:hypothetical protein LELG_04015 [Lodderomyces elongisporus NRRL YB-4239]
MQILQERDSFLSNFEVEQHLKNIKRKYNWSFPGDETEQDTELQAQQNHQTDAASRNGTNNKRNVKQKPRFTECGIDLEIITRDVLLMMKNNSSNINNASATPDNAMTNTKFKELMQFLNKYELMKVEKLQIMNSLPRELVILTTLVEECEERFGEEGCEEIIAKIRQLFPVEEEEEEEEEEQQEEGVQEDAEMEE